MAEVREVMAHCLPGYRIDSVVLLGAGTDHVAYEVNCELVVRFGEVAAEADLLRTVAGFSPLPVPTPVFAAPELGCLAYRKLPGVPLLDMPLASRLRHGPAIGAALGELLSALHATPLELVAGLVSADDYSPEERIAEARQHYETLPATFRSPAADSFLASPVPAASFTPVFCHNDLGIEHILVKDETITGVIDWSDAAITDPANDFGLIYRDLGPAALDAALPAGSDGLRRRAEFVARCSVFEDLAYGLQTGRSRYVDKCLSSLEWLFSAEVA